MSALEVQIGVSASLPDVVGALAAADRSLRGVHPFRDVVVHLDGFLRISSIAMLTAWARDVSQRGLRVHVKATSDVRNYLERMGVLELAGIEGRPRVRARPQGGRFVVMQDVSRPEVIGTAIDAMLEFVLHAYPDEVDLFPSVEWVLGEVLDNVQEHAHDPGCAVAVAQRYEKVHEIELAVVDRGIGLAAALGTDRGGLDAAEAVSLAVRQGVSSKGVGRGNGLAGISQIAALNRGRFTLLSGAASRVQGESGDAETSGHEHFAGTCASVVLRSDHGVDLAQTLIGAGDWTYLDRLWADADGMMTLDVAERLDTVATREAAHRLATYVINVLAGRSGALRLDFGRSRNPTSAFCGELVGILLAGLGPSWPRRVVFSGLTPFGKQILSHASSAGSPPGEDPP